MRPKLLMILSVTIMLTFACSDETNPEEFSSVTSITITDNESDGSLSIQFQVNSIIGVDEFWVFVAKESNKATVTTALASNLSEAQITKVQPSGLSYSANLPASQLDIDGDAIVGGTSYVVFIYGNGKDVLSGASDSHVYPSEQIEQFSSVSSFSITEVITADQVSKIRVEFTANTLEGVEEFWVLVSKNSPDNELTPEYVLTLNSDQYTIVELSGSTSFEVELDENQLDTDGETLKNLGGYRVYVYGKGVGVLSNRSSAINLQQIESYVSLDGIWLHDIANDHNASDIRVVFDPNSTLGVADFRVFVSKKTPTTAVTAAHLETLSTNTYTAVTATDELSYNVRLNQDQIDTDGQALAQDQEYIFYVYSSELETAVSSSETLTLSDNTTINGKYIGEWNDNLFTNIPFSSILDYSGTTMYEGPAYVSTNFQPAWGGADDGKFIMDIDNGNITAFTYNQDLPNYMGGCPGTYTGSGVIDADFNMTINFTGDDCDGHHEDGVITLTRFWK